MINIISGAGFGVLIGGACSDQVGEVCGRYKVPVKVGMAVVGGAGELYTIYSASQDIQKWRQNGVDLIIRTTWRQ